MKPLIALLLLAAAASASAEGARPAAPSGLGSQSSPTIVSHDPLMEQIRSRQLTQPNGGVRAAVRIGSGQTVELKVVELGFEPALKGLKVHPGLLVRQEAAGKTGKAKPARNASEQLGGIDAQGPRKGWAERLLR